MDVSNLGFFTMMITQAYGYRMLGIAGGYRETIEYHIWWCNLVISESPMP